jgi:hypothetical protein
MTCAVSLASFCRAISSMAAAVQATSAGAKTLSALLRGLRLR